MRRMQRKTGVSSQDMYIVVLLTAWLILFAFRIPLQHVIGDLGMAYFSIAGESYLLIGGVLGYGLSEAVSMLVRYRIKREQYKSAQKVLSSALLLGGLVGLLFSLLLGLAGPYLAERLWKFSLAGLALRVMAPSIFFYVLAGVLRGYFQGSGSRVPALHSHLLHAVALAVGGLVGASVLEQYGGKVSALLRSPHYANAYGAMGACFGILAASILCFLHTWIIYLIYRKAIRQPGNRESARGQDTGLHIFHMILGSGVIYLLIRFVFSAVIPIGQILLFQYIEASDGLELQWGAYYGKCSALIGIISISLCMICVFPVRRIILLLDREEYRNARERLGILIHQCAVMTIPAAIWTAVFSENLLELFFQGNNKTAAGWMQWSSILIILAAYAAVFMQCLLTEKKVQYVALTGTAAFMVYILSLTVMLKLTSLRIEAMIMAEILFLAMITVTGFILVTRSFQYRQEWIRSFAVTIVAAALSGLAAMLLNKIFLPLTGSGVSLLIGLAAAVLCYLALLIITRAFRQEELEWIPGGSLLRRISEIFHIY